MGIYLGQLPPAEIARLKAELAETLIANFCYPRFFDPRTQSLRMRPVDRAKRQEVWLFLSSFDFTAWGRIDLTSPELQMYVERLFIQFVQRNRNFFGEQGRRRMSDIRMLIGTSATSVCQGLRNHITGQRPAGGATFGSPRAVISWSAPGVNGRPEATWEQIATSTMFLQQQIQEARGEVKPAPVHDGRATTGNIGRGTTPHRPSLVAGNASNGEAVLPQAPAANPAPQRPATSPLQPLAANPAPQRPATSPLQGPRAPATAKPAASAPATATYRTGTPASAASSPTAARASTVATPEPTVHDMATSALPLQSAKTLEKPSVPQAPEVNGAQAAAPTSAVQARNVSQTIPAPPAATGLAAHQRESSMLTVADEDLAIFEQMRHQLVLWLRVETVRAGLDLASQSPSQLLELLRQQGTFDETRLQVISSLLNLSNQVVKTGQVTMMDYRQALMFYLMHTRL